MPKAYPKEFREDVIRVARNREDGTTVKQIAADFGISESCLTNWLMKADVEDGHRPGMSSLESTELRELQRQHRRHRTVRPLRCAPARRRGTFRPRGHHYRAGTLRLDGKCRWCMRLSYQAHLADAEI